MTSRWNEENRLRTPVTIGEKEGVLAALKMLGYQCCDVRYVVLSHLHEDHAGCLEFFPQAQVFVSDRELTQTMRSYALGEIWVAISKRHYTVAAPGRKLEPGFG